MVIIKDKNMGFVAVPKTASTSISDHLSGVPGAMRNFFQSGMQRVDFTEHVSVREIEREIGIDTWANLTTLGCVRNPWDRAVSAYSFYRNGRARKRVLSGVQRHPKAIFNVALAAMMPFDLWLRVHKGKSCSWYLEGTGGGIGVTHVIKFEELDSSYSKFCSEHGIELLRLEQKNKSERSSYRTYFNDSSIDFIRKKFSDDINNFNYQF